MRVAEDFTDDLIELDEVDELLSRCQTERSRTSEELQQILSEFGHAFRQFEKVESPACHEASFDDWFFQNQQQTRVAVLDVWSKIRPLTRNDFRAMAVLGADSGVLDCYCGLEYPESYPEKLFSLESSLASAIVTAIISSGALAVAEEAAVYFLDREPKCFGDGKYVFTNMAEFWSNQEDARFLKSVSRARMHVFCKLSPGILDRPSESSCVGYGSYGQTSESVRIAYLKALNDYTRHCKIRELFENTVETAFETFDAEMKQIVQSIQYGISASEAIETLRCGRSVSAHAKKSQRKV